MMFASNSGLPMTGMSDSSGIRILDSTAGALYSDAFICISES